MLDTSVRLGLTSRPADQFAATQGARIEHTKFGVGVQYNPRPCFTVSLVGAAEMEKEERQFKAAVQPCQLTIAI